MDFKLLERCGIKDVTATYEELLTLCKRHENGVSVDCSAVEQIDTAFLQMLALLREASLQKKLNVDLVNPSDAFKRYSTLLGLDELLLH